MKLNCYSVGCSIAGLVALTVILGLNWPWWAEIPMATFVIFVGFRIADRLVV